jgi:hypothetical protein
VSVTISGQLRGVQTGRLTIVLTGQPADDGGVDLTGSQVVMGPYQGHVSQLSGTSMVADLTSGSGATMTATIDLQLVPGQSTVTGTVHGTT